MLSCKNSATMGYVPVFSRMWYDSVAMPLVFVIAVPALVPLMKNSISFPSMGLFWCPGAVSVSVAVIVMVSL